MTPRMMVWASNARTGDPLANYLLLILAIGASANGRVFTTLKGLAEITDITAEEIWDLFGTLEDEGYLTMVSRQNQDRPYDTWQLLVSEDVL